MLLPYLIGIVQLQNVVFEWLDKIDCWDRYEGALGTLTLNGIFCLKALQLGAIIIWDRFIWWVVKTAVLVNNLGIMVCYKDRLLVKCLSIVQDCERHSLCTSTFQLDFSFERDWAWFNHEERGGSWALKQIARGTLAFAHQSLIVLKGALREQFWPIREIEGSVDTFHTCQMLVEKQGALLSVIFEALHNDQIVGFFIHSHNYGVQLVVESHCRAVILAHWIWFKVIVSKNATHFDLFELSRWFDNAQVFHFWHLILRLTLNYLADQNIVCISGSLLVAVN